MKIGILALQGAFAEHAAALDSLGAEHFEIRRQSDLSPCEGLILPGGESTVMRKLLRELGLFEPIRAAIREGLPVFGTCAGLLLLARRLEGDNAAPCFGCMDITARRNAYGRQLGSFETAGGFAGREIPMVFIRAPYIEACGEGVAVLSRTDGKITAAREENLLVTAFHPELTADLTVHRYFLDMAAAAGQSGFLHA